MTQEIERSTKCYRYGSLIIDPEHGCITSPQGEIRLGPVNMSVLVQLVENQGKVVSRSAIFDSVWKNQIVSDDVLTRCISDLRKTLKSLNEATQFIETLPKRGYRWLVETEVLEANASQRCALDADATESVQKNDHDLEQKQQHLAKDANPVTKNGSDPDLIENGPSALNIWGKRIVIGIVGLLFISTGSLWIIDNFVISKGIKVALIPIQASNQELQPLAMEIEEQLASQFVAISEIKFLSRSAVRERPANPFPYLVGEFGTQWIIEGRIRNSGKLYRVSLDLVDARTATISHSFSREVKLETSNISQVCTDFAHEISLFLSLEK